MAKCYESSPGILLTSMLYFDRANIADYRHRARHAAATADSYIIILERASEVRDQIWPAKILLYIVCEHCKFKTVTRTIKIVRARHTSLSSQRLVDNATVFASQNHMSRFREQHGNHTVLYASRGRQSFSFNKTGDILRMLKQLRLSVLIGQLSRRLIRTFWRYKKMR
jgi:hypothetical protein